MIALGKLLPQCDIIDFIGITPLINLALYMLASEGDGNK